MLYPRITFEGRDLKFCSHNKSLDLKTFLEKFKLKAKMCVNILISVSHNLRTKP